MQSPTPPFAGGVDASHGFGAHVAATKFPAEHTDAPETMYPSPHVGWHVDSDASSSVQSPTSPFAGGVDASHGSPTAARHVAGTIVPSEPHEVAPDGEYPSSHVGWHVDPGASSSVQSPTAPFAGALDASHGAASHVAAVNTPSSHVEGPERSYPELQVAKHSAPLASAPVPTTHVPSPPLAGAPGTSQGFGSHVAEVKTPPAHEVAPDAANPSSQLGAHDDSDASSPVHSPSPPFVGGEGFAHAAPTHVADKNSPPEHIDGPDAAYPESHVGWHVDPDASCEPHVPRAPNAGAETSHFGPFFKHTAAVSVPAEHAEGPEATYPPSHPGWHVDPDASESVQSPTAPFAGASDASHWSSNSGSHDVSTPPCVSSPGALTYPAAHGSHAPDETR